MDEKEAYFLDQIINGQNVKLYETLMKHKDRFTQEQTVLGITPLFAGKKKSLEIAVAYLNNELKDYVLKEDDKRKDKSLYEQEKDRIKELINGEFKLPQSVEELLENADRFIVEYQELSDMVSSKLFSKEIRVYPNGFYKPVIQALKEVKQKIIDLRAAGLFE